MKKTVLITGASHGIGKAAAHAFAAAGYQLIINARRDGHALEELKQQLFSLYGAPCLIAQGDVSQEGFVKEMFQKALNKFQHIDVLINNAGISYIGLLTDMSLLEWNQILSTNLTSAFLCSKEAIPGMVSRKSGKIINVSSVWGTHGASCEVAYSASKGGLNTFTKALARELAPSNIQVNAVACGCIDTRMNACFDSAEREALEEEIPAGRFGQPEEVASLLVQIASGHTYLTGQIITLDGGWM